MNTVHVHVDEAGTMSVVEEIELQTVEAGHWREASRW